VPQPHVVEQLPHPPQEDIVEEPVLSVHPCDCVNVPPHKLLHALVCVPEPQVVEHEPHEPQEDAVL